MRKPVEGPAVWRGEELAGMPEWNQRWAAQELAELEASASAADGERVATPLLDARCRAVREQLETGCGAVRMRGLACAGRGEEDLGRLLLRLAGEIGTPVSQTTGGDLLFRVADAGLDARDASARGPNSRKALTFHSDRCDVIGFLCVRPAVAGGENLVVSAGAVHNEIAKTRPDLLEALYAPFYWQRHNIDTGNAYPWYRMPVFAQVDGHFAITLMQVLIDRAHRSPELPDLTPAQREALETVQRLAADPRFHLRFRQEPGDILLLNNYVTLHSRTEFTDAPGNRGRLLLRVWISVPNSRPLTPQWRPHYGETAAGATRGGIVPHRPNGDSPVV